MLDLMGKQGRSQGRQLLVRLEPPEALGGLLHGGAGPAERHPGVPPAFDVAADLPDGPVHVLDDVGAGQRPAQFDRQSKAGDGEDCRQRKAGRVSHRSYRSRASCAGHLKRASAGKSPPVPTPKFG